MRHYLLRLPPYLPYPAFVALYLLFDAIAYMDPLYGLNITPWNPDPALGLVFWLRYGGKAALPWCLALLAGEVFVRGMPAGPVMAVLGSLWLTFAYGLIGAGLRHVFRDGGIFDNRRQLLLWVALVAGGTLCNGLGYITLLSAGELIPAGEWRLALWRFCIGDTVGVLVSMPLLWMLASARGRARLHAALWRRETAAYLALASCVLWGVFGPVVHTQFKHFYFLFLPVIWAASRQGLPGTALMVFLLQLGIISVLKWRDAFDIEVYELQMLDAVLALVGFFIGIVVDEVRQVADELKQSLRLAAAGEMAAALAHELNQPMTALSAYGKACEYLLERGRSGPELQHAISRMVLEAGRAAEVVRRLRDFFRTGAMQLETVEAGALIETLRVQFRLPFVEHNVELTVLAPAPLRLCVDRLQIELVLRNLLANALEAVQARPRDQRRIRVEAEDVGGGRLRLSVEDSGAGVSGALAARLFEPFVSSKASGLGLGLVLSRAIVEAHGGSLWVEAAGHGIFRFMLPLMEPGERCG